uniref:Mitochondrial carrier protein n=1 Tax=Glossina austeni TaxID=7395 RepID=A0A1A9VR87_GLOAU
MSAMSSTKSANVTSSKLSLISHIKYEHLVAGISGGVTSTLILHPLDLIKIRFAGYQDFPSNLLKQKIKNLSTCMCCLDLTGHATNLVARKISIFPAEAYGF